MTNFIKNYLLDVKNVKIVTDKYNNLYVTKGNSNKYPCIVAHTDEIHIIPDRIRNVILDNNIIYSRDLEGFICGCGADDKNGIYVALELLTHLDNIKCFFPVCEEIGYYGSSRCNLSFFDNCSYLIQPDRRGVNDFIEFSNGITICSEEFIKDSYSVMQQYGYRVESGIGTDVGQLKLRGLNKSCVNISCGFFNEHTEFEYTHLPSLDNCLKFTKALIDKLKNKTYIHTSYKRKVRLPITKCDTCTTYNCMDCSNYNLDY